jgi:hypothetical protein
MTHSIKMALSGEGELRGGDMVEHAARASHALRDADVAIDAFHLAEEETELLQELARLARLEVAKARDKSEVAGLMLQDAHRDAVLAEDLVEDLKETYTEFSTQFSEISKDSAERVACVNNAFDAKSREEESTFAISFMCLELTEVEVASARVDRAFDSAENASAVAMEARLKANYLKRQCEDLQDAFEHAVQKSFIASDNSKKASMKYQVCAARMESATRRTIVTGTESMRVQVVLEDSDHIPTYGVKGRELDDFHELQDFQSVQILHGMRELQDWKTLIKLKETNDNKDMQDFHDLHFLKMSTEQMDLHEYNGMRDLQVSLNSGTTTKCHKSRKLQLTQFRCKVVSLSPEREEQRREAFLAEKWKKAAEKEVRHAARELRHRQKIYEGASAVHRQAKRRCI